MGFVAKPPEGFSDLGLGLRGHRGVLEGFGLLRGSVRFPVPSSVVFEELLQGLQGLRVLLVEF